MAIERDALLASRPLSRILKGPNPMDRRAFLAMSGATTLIPASAFASGFIDYTPGAIKTALEAGETVFVDF